MIAILSFAPLGVAAAQGVGGNKFAPKIRSGPAPSSPAIGAPSPARPGLPARTGAASLGGAAPGVPRLQPRPLGQPDLAGTPHGSAGHTVHHEGSSPASGKEHAAPHPAKARI